MSKDGTVSLHLVLIFSIIIVVVIAGDIRCKEKENCLPVLICGNFILRISFCWIDKFSSANEHI